MTPNKKYGAAITLVTAIIAAVGLVVDFFHVQPAVGLAVVGIVIGTGVARGAFSRTPDEKKRNE